MKYIENWINVTVLIKFDSCHLCSFQTRLDWIGKSQDVVMLSCHNIISNASNSTSNQFLCVCCGFSFRHISKQIIRKLVGSKLLALHCHTLNIKLFPVYVFWVQTQFGHLLNNTDVLETLFTHLRIVCWLFYIPLNLKWHVENTFYCGNGKCWWADTE